MEFNNNFFNEYDNLSEKEFYSQFAFIMQKAIRCKVSLFSWLVSNMYEIFDKDKETFETMEKKYNLCKLEVEEENILASSFFEFFNGEYTIGEAISFGTIANAFISYKSGFLSMEEYYEIRDMFVPFNLPISYVVKDTKEILNIIRKNNPEEIKLILLNKLGKSFLSEPISDEMILSALDELNFNEED